jgi:hypothetical protein
VLQVVRFVDAEDEGGGLDGVRGYLVVRVLDDNTEG